MGNDTASIAVKDDKNIPELQSIRGIASCFVVIGHCIAYYATPPWWNFVKRFLNSQAQVEIFFILSGFVLAKSLLSRGVSSIEVRDFYIKRLFRIYPALFAASSVACVYVIFLHYQIPVPGISRWMTERFRMDRYSPLYFIASFAGMLAFLIPPVWTIFIEIVASIFMPFVAILIKIHKSAFWLFFAFAFAISFFSNGFMYYHIDIYLFDFFLGSSLLLLNSYAERLKELSNGAKMLIALIALIFGNCTRAFTSADVWDPHMQMYEVFFLSIVIFMFGMCGLKSRLLKSRFLVWLGDISYSVYLIHFTIMCLWAKVFALVWPSAPVIYNGWPVGIALCIPTLITAIVSSKYLYEYIEKPGIKLGKMSIKALS